jgi:N-methylhydantoinase B
VARGLVSAEGARRYGVVIADDGSVDATATGALRAELREQRGEPGLFDFGGTIEEIKARCRAETHLEPPSAPTFARVMGQGG